jgi:hypothetical protein
MATCKIDIEVVEDKILEIIKAALPAKLIEINTEKGDTLLTNIAEKNYLPDFYQKELTPPLFIFYGITEPEVTSNGSDFATTWTVFYHILIEDINKLSLMRKKVLRYTRALYEVVCENSDKISRYGNIPEISSLTPQDVHDIVNETPYKMGGITLKITLS